MIRDLRYLIAILLLSTFQVYAGVVKDAEEELKKMGRGQEQRVNAESERAIRSYPARSTTRSRSVGSNNTKTDQATSAGSDGTVQQPGVSAPVTSTDEAVEESGRAKLDKMEKQQGRLISFGIVLLLALLVFVATVAGKRLGKAE